MLERIMASAAGRALAAVPAEAAGRAVAPSPRLGRPGGGDCDDGAKNDGAKGEVLFPSDPLRRRKDDCLDRLAGIARLEARIAAEKVKVLAELVEVSTALNPPALSPQEATAQEMALVAEVACALTVGERTAGALLAESHTLTTDLPLTLSALQAGVMSWQHARIMVDETTNLDRAAARALEGHFLDPDAPNPHRGGPVGDLVASRFRHKARI
ncbi:endonuclease, partial [Arthrobacter sp. HMWF013]